MNHVDDIDHFRSCSWGRISWRMVYKGDHTLNQKAEKFKNDCLKNHSHNIKKYNLYDFSHGVQVGSEKN